MKWLKKLLAVVILFVFVIAIAFTALVMFVDPNKLKPIVINEVKTRTGYTLQIDGQLSWSLYPHISIAVPHMSLSLPQQATAFIDVEKVNIAMSLMDLLRGQEKWQGDIHIASLRYLNIHAKDVQFNATWQDQVLNLQSIQASLYGGSLTGTAQGRELDNNPRWVWDAQFKQVQVKPLLQDLNGSSSKLMLSGLADVTFIGQTQGSTNEQVLSHLNGTMTFNVTQGVLEGVDLNYLLQTADAIINRRDIPAPASLNQTTFTNFTGAAQIKNGIAETNHLTLTSPTFVVNGTGTLNLMNQVTYMQLQVKSQQLLNTQWEIPVLVTGDVTRPDVRLDRLEIEKMLAKEEIDKIKSKASEFINQNISGKPSQYLQKLLGQ